MWFNGVLLLPLAVVAQVATLYLPSGSYSVLGDQFGRVAVIAIAVGTAVGGTLERATRELERQPRALVLMVVLDLLFVALLFAVTWGRTAVG